MSINQAMLTKGNRTRDEISRSLRDDAYAKQPHFLQSDLLAAILEVLLDIREFMAEEKLKGSE